MNFPNFEEEKTFETAGLTGIQIALDCEESYTESRHWLFRTGGYMKTDAQKSPATPEEIWRILREVSEERKKTEKQFRETDKQIKETNREFNKLYALFNSQWSKLVESLVEGKLVELLQSRGIDVSETGLRIQGSYTDEIGEIQRREIDIIAAYEETFQPPI